MSPAERAPVPPHCPFRDCDSHTDPGAWRAIKKGFYRRQALPRKIQRYRCSRCQRSFSSQTFSPSYWLRQPQLQTLLFFRVLGCSGFRQIAWELGVAPSTIQRQVERLGRHCLLLHEFLRPAWAPQERLVLDGLRSFEFGQYWPFDVNLLIGQSYFIYGFQDAELRRSGAMTPFQRRQRLRLEQLHGRPDPQATRKSVQELLTRQLPPGARVELDTDEHRAYPQAIQRLPNRDIRHRTTPSKAARTPQNPLFPANLGDLLIRHTGANQKRETIAFSKRRQGALYRLAIWVVARNYLRPASVRRKLPPPGVAVGAIARPWSVRDVLRTRLLPWRFELPGWMGECYFGRIPTRRMARCRAHTLQYAA
jgi:transposase-like protein